MQLESLGRHHSPLGAWWLCAGTGSQARLLTVSSQAARRVRHRRVRDAASARGHGGLVSAGGDMRLIAAQVHAALTPPRHNPPTRRRGPTQSPDSARSRRAGRPPARAIAAPGKKQGHGWRSTPRPPCGRQGRHTARSEDRARVRGAGARRRDGGDGGPGPAGAGSTPRGGVRARAACGGRDAAGGSAAGLEGLLDPGRRLGPLVRPGPRGAPPTPHPPPPPELNHRPPRPPHLPPPPSPPSCRTAAPAQPPPRASNPRRGRNFADAGRERRRAELAGAGWEGGGPGGVEGGAGGGALA
jgi:translation initiation factor IF-2